MKQTSFLSIPYPLFPSLRQSSFRIPFQFILFIHFNLFGILFLPLFSTPR